MTNTATITTTIFRWRLAGPDDVPSINRIFNETVDGGGHTPVLRRWTEKNMAHVVSESRQRRWPLWILLAGDETVAWSQVKPINWGQEACQQAGEFSIYIARAWWGTGVAGEVITRVYQEIRRYGFTSLSCWILGNNRKSLMLARAIRLQPWGRLPQVVNYGGELQDVQIWGTQLDEPAWCDHIERLLARQARRRGTAAQGAGCPAGQPH